MGNLDRFFLYLAQNNRSQATVHRHRNNLRLLLKYAPNFQKDEIDHYFLTLKERKCKNTYLNSLISTIRVWATFQNLNFDLQKYSFFRKEPFVKATMSDEEIEAFLGLSRPSKRGQGKKTWQKWTTFFSIMAYTGMRPGEIANLTINEVDWGRNIFIVKESKTHIPRLVPIPPNIELLLKEYLTNTNGQLFPRVDNVDWHYNFHTRIKMLEIRRTNLTPYSFRHSLITRLLEEDVNLFKVQKLVGHRRIDTTAQYTHLTTKDIQEAIRKHPLVRRFTSPQEIIKALIGLIKSFNLQNDNRFHYELRESEKKLKLKVEIVP